MDIQSIFGIVVMVAGFMAAFFFAILVFFPSSFDVQALRNSPLQVRLRGLFQWSVLGFFGVGLYLGETWAIMAFGVLFDALLVYSLIEEVINKRQLPFFYAFSRVVDFIFAICITAYMLYLVPDKMFQTVLISIVSALMGGCCTLIGVLMTLKRSEQDRMNEKIDENRPFVVTMFTDTFRRETSMTQFHARFRSTGNKAFQYSFAPLFLKNSDHSYAQFAGFVINGELVFFETEKCLWKNEACEIVIDNEISSGKELSKLSLLIGDTIHNLYHFPLSFDARKNDGGHNIIEVKDTFEGRLVDTGGLHFKYRMGRVNND